MFTAIKGYIYAAAGLLVIGAVTGSYLLGRSHQATADESRELRDGFKSLVAQVEQSTKVQDRMMGVSQALVDKTAELKSNTVVIREAQKSNARANPVSPSCIIDGVAIELRNQQIDQVRRTLGLDLPAERKGSVPASPIRQ